MCFGEFPWAHNFASLAPCVSDIEVLTPLGNFLRDDCKICIWKFCDNQNVSENNSYGSFLLYMKAMLLHKIYIYTYQKYIPILTFQVGPKQHFPQTKSNKVVFIIHWDFIHNLIILNRELQIRTFQHSFIYTTFECPYLRLYEW